MQYVRSSRICVEFFTTAVIFLRFDVGNAGDSIKVKTPPDGGAYHFSCDTGAPRGLLGMRFPVAIVFSFFVRNCIF